MTDLDLLLFGMSISFIAASGAYVFMRERFHRAMPRETKPAPAPVEVPLRVDVARPVAKA